MTCSPLFYCCYYTLGLKTHRDNCNNVPDLVATVTMTKVKMLKNLEFAQSTFFYVGWQWIVYIIIGTFAAIALLLFLLSRFPLPTESDLAHRSFPFFFLYYGGKYLWPIPRPPLGSGLDSFFANTYKPSSCEELCDVRTIKLSAIGDLMVRFDMQRDGVGRLWDDVGGHLFDADFCMANLEFAINPYHIIHKIIRYSVDTTNLEQLFGDGRFGRFDHFFLGNNHLKDSLSQGIQFTTDYLDEQGFSHVGANRTPVEQDDFPLITLSGIRIALLSYTFSTNGVALEPGWSHGVNVVRFNALRDKDYDPSLIHRHIDQARKRGADIIVASHHWGLEFEYYPPVRIVQRAHELLDAGIDIIIGHHPHILNPAEWYTTRDGRTGLALYSLGSLTTYALLGAIKNLSSIAHIEIIQGIDAQGRRVVRIGEVSLMPVLFLKKWKKGVAAHRLVPLLRTAEQIRAAKPPCFMSPIECRRLLAVEKQYRRAFLQSGFIHH
jgi:poly-gamma-glutamate synthesis protein (capsule biosynthesis protein)